MSNNRFSVKTVFSGVDQISGTMAKITASVNSATNRIGKGLSSISSKMNTVHAGIKGTATAIAGIGIAGGFAAVQLGKAGAEYEQAITAVGAVGLQTLDQIADLDAKAKELGATTKFTATEAANAMEVMARAGFKNSEILSGVDGVLSAAAASGLEIAEVANHVSNALKGMGLEASEAGRVSDVLALASSRTNSSIGSLGDSLSNVASTAREFGIPLEDVTAGVALLQDVGLDASVAGSALNTMLTQLAKPTDALKAKMKDMGVEFQDANHNMLPFEDVMANLSKASKQAGGNMDQVAFFADLVGLRGQKAAANLKTLFDSGKFSDLAKELKNAEGSAKKMAELRMNNTIGDLTLFESAVDGVKVALFETEKGPLRNIIQSMTKWVTANQTLIVSKFQHFMLGVRDVLKVVADNFETIVTWGQRLAIGLGVFYTMKTAVAAAQVALAAFELTMGAVTVAQRLLSASTSVDTAARVASTLAVSTNTAAQVGSTIAAGAAKAMQLAGAAAIGLNTLATQKFTLSMLASRAAIVGNTIATQALNVVQGLRAAAMVVGTIATTTFTGATAFATVGVWSYVAAAQAAVVATFAAAVPFLPLIALLGAATVAVGALYLAWNQLSDLSAQTGDLGIFGTIGKMWEMGTFDPAKAIDAHMNEQAIAEANSRPALTTSTAAEAPVMSLPPGYVQPQLADYSTAQTYSPDTRSVEHMLNSNSNVTAEVQLKLPDGVEAEVKKASKGLNVKKTGKP